MGGRSLSVFPPFSICAAEASLSFCLSKNIFHNKWLSQINTLKAEGNNVTSLTPVDNQKLFMFLEQIYFCLKGRITEKEEHELYPSKPQLLPWIQ